VLQFISSIFPAAVSKSVMKSKVEYNQYLWIKAARFSYLIIISWKKDQEEKNLAGNVPGTIFWWFISPKSKVVLKKVNTAALLYSVRGLERSELGGSHGYAQGAFGTDFYDRSTRTIVVGTKLRTEYRPVIKIGR